MNIPRLSVRNPVAANLIMWAIVVAGLFSVTSLTREFFPTSSPEKVVITVPYPGGTPEEIERSVTRPLEREIEGVEDLDEVASTVYEGLSVTVITMEDDADRNEVINDLRSEVDRAEADFPEEAEDAELEPLRPFIPVISVVVYGEVPESRLHEGAIVVRDEIRDLGGISRVLVSGVRDPEIWVEVGPERLEEYGLTFAEVGRAVAASNLDLPGGQLRTPRGNVTVRTLGEESRAVELEDLVVRGKPGGGVVRLRDLGGVRHTFEDRVERGYFDGKPAAQITIFKAPEDDALAIADRVKAYVEANRDRFGEGLRLDTITDLSRFIAQRIDLMARNGRAGFVLVIITLALFLTLRVAFWVGAGLAISFLGTFAVMKLFGATINLISLFGLIIVLGLIVDDAIIVAERIFTRIREGTPARQAAVRGAAEVSLPVLAAVATTIAAFLPLAFVEGRIGSFLEVLPLVVIAALLVSLVEAFMILPSHLAHTGRWRFPEVPLLSRAASAGTRFKNRLLEHWVPEGFSRILAVLLRWRYVTCAAAVSLLLVAAGLFAGGIVPFVFLQSTDAETISVDIEMASGTPEERTVEVVRSVEREVLGYPESSKVFSVVGTSFSDRGREVAADPATVGQVNVELLPAEVREDRGLRASPGIVTALRKAFGDVAGARKIAVVARTGGPAGPDIELRVQGEDMESLGRAVSWLREQLAAYTPVTEIRDDLQLGKLEARVALRPTARPLGLATRDLAQQVRNAHFGFEAQELQGEREAVKVRVLLPEEARDGLDDLARLRIAGPGGARIPLGEVASLSTGRSYATLSRVDGRRAATIQAEVDDQVAESLGTTTSDITADLERRLDEMEARFPGVSVSFEGEKKETQESLGSLKVGFPLALFLIYCIVAVLFRSYIQPVVVMLAIPFSMAGAVFGHLIMGYPFTILSVIGMVALAGIVVNDSLILVNFINRRRQEGLRATEGAVSGARDRVRAIMLTSITTIAGLAPLMLERSFQAQFLIPMAVSIVFGLALATLVTPLLLPCLYMMLEDLRAALRWLFTGRFTRNPAGTRPG